VRAQASNTNDWGDLSEMNIEGGHIQTIPLKMKAPTRGTATSVTNLQVNWVALTGDSTGSAIIDSYNLQWDKGTNAATWFDLSGDGVNFVYSTQLTGDFTSEVVPGTQYKMRVRAHNAHGWSDWSSILIIRSTGLPQEPQPPSTLIENGIIKVSWVDPVANYEAIDSYRILFAQSDYITLTEILLYCDGLDSDVIAA